MREIAQNVLPLEAPDGFSRDIKIDSCVLDEKHFQVRGQLTDTRTDYVDPCKRIVVHCMVARLTVNTETNLITAAEFGLPKMAFKGKCEKMPAGAELLIGLDTSKGLSFRIRELFGGKRSCFHVCSLLLSMLPAFAQCKAWNLEFKPMDESMEPSEIPDAMAKMQQGFKNSCHAWVEDEGAICVDFENGRYEAMLDRIAPRLLGRWKPE